MAVAVRAVWVDVSGNGLGAMGGCAIAGALPHLTSLTTLKYVRSEGGVCDVTVMRRVVGVPVHELQWVIQWDNVICAVRRVCVGLRPKSVLSLLCCTLFCAVRCSVLYAVCCVSRMWVGCGAVMR